MNEERLVKGISRYREYSFIKVLRETMLILFPVILIGAFCWTFSNCILNSNSLVGQITQINGFLNYNFLGQLLGIFMLLPLAF